MKKRIGILTLFFCSVFSMPLVADGVTGSIEWDRSSAMTAIHSVDIDAAVYSLSDIASLADGRYMVDRLNQVENRTDWPLPAREAVIYRFTQSLANLPADAVSADVMAHLKNYQARTLVPNEEHPTAYTPLFNIRAAASGVENGWQMQAFAFKAQSLLESSPERLASEFENASKINQRRATLQVLGAASLADAIAVQNAALDRLLESPAMTQLLAVAVTVTHDSEAIERLLMDGRGAGLSQAFKNIGETLSLAEIGELLTFAITRAPAQNATIAMATWAPVVQYEPGTRDLLLASLADPELGASAALVLARQPDIQTIKILQDIATGDSIAATRAQMALDLNRDKLIGDGLIGEERR